MFVKTGGKVGAMETLNMKPFEDLSLKVSGRLGLEPETLVRIVATEQTGSSLVVATVLKQFKGFRLYWSFSMNSMLKDSSPEELIWDSVEKLHANELKDLSITKSPRRIYLAIENEEFEPEIVILRPEENSSSLIVCKIISIPDFKSISSLAAVEWANRLVVGCNQVIVVFKEEGVPTEKSCKRFSVTEIYTHVFQGKPR